MCVKYCAAKMKRDRDGNIICSEPVDLDDLEKKIKAVVDFISQNCSHKDYGDDFLIGLWPDNHDRNCKNVRLTWFCKYLTLTMKNPDDKRDHEALVKKHFKHFNVSIEKLSHAWEITVSTSSAICQCAHRVIVPASSAN